MPLATCLTDSKLRPTHLAALLVIALAACGGGGSSSGPSLQSVTFGTGQAYAIVGVQQKLTLTGQYSDGTTAPVTTGVLWRSSDPAVASVDDTGVLAAWAKGNVEITATHGASGLSARVNLTTRVVVALTAGDALPAAGHVDTTAAYFRVSGLTPGAMYTPAVFDMTDDVDIAVYSDISMAPEAKLCASGLVGHDAESCAAPASSSGELWVAVDGQWTQAGASFELDVPAAQAVELVGTVAFPADLPYSGSVGATKQFLKVTGLTPGAAYEVRISNLTADIDVEVYADEYEYASLCESYQSGVAEDFCDATPGPAGELIIEIDGETSTEGGSYTLALTAQ